MVGPETSGLWLFVYTFYIQTCTLLTGLLLKQVSLQDKKNCESTHQKQYKYSVYVQVYRFVCFIQLQPKSLLEEINLLDGLS